MNKGDYMKSLLNSPIAPFIIIAVIIITVSAVKVAIKNIKKK